MKPSFAVAHKVRSSSSKHFPPYDVTLVINQLEVGVKISQSRDADKSSTSRTIERASTTSTKSSNRHQRRPYHLTTHTPHHHVPHRTPQIRTQCYRPGRPPIRLNCPCSIFLCCGTTIRPDCFPGRQMLLCCCWSLKVRG